jgi:hypothetical protein
LRATNFVVSLGLQFDLVKRKITVLAAIFFRISLMMGRLSGFNQRANALSTQHFADFLAILKNTYGLEIGLERPRSRLIGPRTIATEGRFLTTMCTLSHNSTSLYNQSHHREKTLIKPLWLPVYSRTSLPQNPVTSKFGLVGNQR